MCLECDTTCTQSCGFSCNDTCEGGCDGSCNGSCLYDCSGQCSSCVGTCNTTCTGGCNTTCTGSCTGYCNTTCTGSCSNTCTGNCNGCTGCTGTCSAACDNACTAANQAQVIAGLGSNIIRGNIIMAKDFLDLKLAIEKEYQRRGKTVPPPYSPAISAGNIVPIHAITQVFDDCYNFNASSANDWRGTVTRFDPVVASKIEPCVAFIKTLATQITKK